MLICIYGDKVFYNEESTTWFGIYKQISNSERIPLSFIINQRKTKNTIPKNCVDAKTAINLVGWNI